MTPFSIRSSIVGTLLVAAALLYAPRAALAQIPQLPPGMTPEQIEELLRTNPQYQQLIRQRVLGSGMSPEEVRLQLVRAGYPADLLDPYLYGPAGEGSLIADNTFEAIAALGVNAFRQGDAPAEAAGPREAAQPDTAPAAEPALELFGLRVFRQESSQFEPLVTGPVDDSYVVGPGDILVVILSGAVQSSDVLEVTKEGFVLIPNVGQLFVANLTLEQVRELFFTRLRQVYSGLGRGPNARTTLDIAVARVRVQSVRVIGEVERPNTYQVAATGGVLSAIYSAGGLTPKGNFRRVEVRRGATLVGTVDLYEYLLSGTVRENIVLRPGDVVFVPIHGPRIKIGGEVNRPAIYEVTPQESLRDLIGMAGGFTPLAATSSATIDRILPPDQRPEPGFNRTVVTASLAGVLNSMAPRVPLAPDDSVTVHRVHGGNRATIAIAGSVWQPGRFSLLPGMRLWDAIGLAGGLRPETYGGRVQILRTLPDSTRRMFGLPLTGGDGVGPAENPTLSESDSVMVFARTDFRARRHVTVHGAVGRPGTIIEFADSMTLRDAILLAGGLADNAYLAEAQVSRVTDPAGGAPAAIVSVPLDSTYVVDETGYLTRAVGANAPPFILHPYDNVFVRRQPGWQLQRNVVLTGEVRFPGAYTLTRPDERLRNVIERAGGLTDDAYAAGIGFYRRADETRRIGVDLERVLGDARHRDNILLEAGDSVHVPRFAAVVNVMGAVQRPGPVTYVRGSGVGYYVDAAGGFTARADKGRTFIEQPNGHVERGRDPNAGATVVVPTKDPADRSTLVELAPFFTAMIQVLAAAATLIIALNQGN